MSTIVALRELNPLVLNILRTLAKEKHDAVEVQSDEVLIRFLDLVTPPGSPVFAVGNAALSWQSARALAGAKEAPWFWNNISEKDGEFSAWDEKGDLISTYKNYRDAVAALLQYASTMGHE